MNNDLINEILEQTKIFFHNLKTCIQTCDMELELCGMKVWKHIYHTLHSVDCWFINPARYQEPPFHEPGLNSLDIKSEKILTKADLLLYFETVQAKITSYLAALTDEALCEKPEGCKYTRMALILGSYRHTCCHIGNINATTIIETGKWPRVVGMDGDFTKELYEE